MDAANILSSQTANGPLRDPKEPILYSRYTFLYHYLTLFTGNGLPHLCNIYPVILDYVHEGNLVEKLSSHDNGIDPSDWREIWANNQCWVQTQEPN